MLVLIAFSFLCVSHPQMSKAVSVKNRGLCMVLTIWLYALVMVTPTLTTTLTIPAQGKIGYSGAFGYNPGLGKCDYMDSNGPRVLFYTIGFGLPLILIVVSYAGIWRTTTHSSSSLQPSV